MRISRERGDGGRFPFLSLYAFLTLLLAMGARILVSLPLAFLPPLCPLLAHTGFPCPTCGATRALAALAGGEWVLALTYNPLITLTATVVLITGVLSGARRLADRPGWRIELGKEEISGLRWLAFLVLGANWLYLLGKL